MVLLAAAWAAGLGAATAVAATGLHERGWTWWTLAVVASLAGALAVPPGAARLGYGAGWLLVVWLAATPRPEGDYLVSSGARGLAFLGSALLLLVVCVTTVPLRRRSPDVAESEDRAPGT